MQDNKDWFVEKKIVEHLMPKTDPTLSRRMTVNSIHLMDQMDDFSVAPGDVNIQIRSIKDPSCFRIRFSLPTYLLFHVSMENLRSMHTYYRTDRYSTPVGFLPSYNCNLNHITLLRSYSKALGWAEATGGKDSDYVCRKFSNDAGEPMEQSSLNFLLQNKSKDSDVPASEAKVIADAFEILCWSMPLDDTGFRYSTMHNFVYHTASKILAVRRIFKTLALIKSIDSTRYVMEHQRKIQYVHATAHILCQSEEKLFFKETDVIVSEPDASRMKPGMLANVILDKPVLRGQGGPITIHGMVGEGIEPGDPRCLVAAVMWKKIQEISDGGLCHAGGSDTMMQAVGDMISSNPDVFDPAWRGGFDESFDEAVRRMFPLVLDDGGAVYHIPPPLLAYITSLDKAVLGEREDLLNLLKFVDQADPKNRHSTMRLRTSPLGKAVQTGSFGVHFSSLVKNVYRIANRIAYSRLFARASWDVTE